MRLQIEIESDTSTFKCVLDDIQPTKMQDAIDILSVAFNKVIEAYKTHDEDIQV